MINEQSGLPNGVVCYRSDLNQGAVTLDVVVTGAYLRSDVHNVRSHNVNCLTFLDLPYLH